MSKMNPVRCDVDGFSILLPAESQLPGIKRDLPQYGTNVGRLARTVAEKYPRAGVIDIGANVGDTLAAIRHYCAEPVLCVEGAAEYVQLLEENARQFAEVEIEAAFVGGEGIPAAGRVVLEKGTGWVEPGKGEVKTKTLAEIVAGHSRFAGAKLLKIDTDGWDSPIVQGNAAYLRQQRPVVFFEYDPHFFIGELAEGPRVFAALRNAGYQELLFWENSGDFALHATLDQRELLVDLHEAVVGRGKMRYWDIAAFAVEDGDLAQRQRAEELAYFRKLRGRGKS